MPWSTNGLLYLPKDGPQTEERQHNNLHYITVTGINKHTYDVNKIDWIRLTIVVPPQEVDKARELLQPGRSFYCLHAKLAGTKLKSGYIAHNNTAQWRDIVETKVGMVSGVKSQADPY